MAAAAKVGAAQFLSDRPLSDSCYPANSIASVCTGVCCCPCRWKAWRTTTCTATTWRDLWASASPSSLPPQVGAGAAGFGGRVSGACRPVCKPARADVCCCGPRNIGTLQHNSKPALPSFLFRLSGLESPEFCKSEALANEMGLFLQKTNIIRDYLVGVLVVTVVMALRSVAL